MTRSRQLAAIMFTDIEGYTALMQRNEEKAIQAREKHRQIFNSVTEQHNGRILQYYGDGTLSIFNSAIDAVECGTEMQLKFLKEPSIPVRIGIHIGDIIFSEDEIIGDGVNVASRIESLAVAGSVFISDKVYDEIKNHESLKTSLLKTFKLKNIERPTDVYAISNEGLIVPNPEDIRGKTEKDPASQTDKHEPGAFVSEPILATKLYIPPSRPKVVLRPRLIERMMEGSQRKLVLISAPPGFGKTTLVGEWIAGSDQSAAWLSLDKGDNDPARFLAYIVAAIQTIAPDIGERALSLLQSPQSQPAESILMALLNDITTIPPDDFTLVLDDYHVITTRMVDDALIFLLEHMPPNMHMVITSREDPKVPLPRLRARGQLIELRPSDLRFTPSEAAEFLNQVMGLDLSADSIAVLESRTEGWVAGLQLAALSMQGREDIQGFIKAFSGEDRYVVDYLVEEVLQSQSYQIRNFLLQSSILDRLNGSLCDAVTGLSGSKGLLETLERGNLFVIPLDDKRQWYRFHHLFAEVLRTRLNEEQADQVPALNKLASEWYEKNGLAPEAVHHALVARDWVRAAELIELAWPAMNESCQPATWMGWANALPDELVSKRPVLCVGYAWASIQCGELELGEAYLNDADRLLEDSANADQGKDTSSDAMIVVDRVQYDTLPASIANARAYKAQALGDVSGTLKYAKRAFELLPEDEYLKRATSAALIGFVHLEGGDLEEAQRSFTDLRAIFQKAGDISATLSITFIIADITMAQGRLTEAIKISQQSLKLAMDHGEPFPMGTEDLYRGLGELYLERGDQEFAMDYMQKSQTLSEQTKAMDWQYRLSLAQSRLKEIQGDLDAAIELLDKAEGFYVRNPMPDLHPVATLKSRIWIRQGKLAEAMAWAGEKGLSFDDELSYLHQFEHMTLARLLIALYEREGKSSYIHEAIDLLSRLLLAAEEGHWIGNIIEILVLLSLAHKAHGDIPPALDSLERALTIAEPEGYLRIFVDEGVPMSELLSEVAGKNILADYTGKLLSEFEPTKK